MKKPLLLKLVGKDDKRMKGSKDGDPMRIFPEFRGHYSLRQQEGKWTLNKISKNYNRWIFLGPAYMKRLLAGGKITVDEDILSLESGQLD